MKTISLSLLLALTPVTSSAGTITGTIVPSFSDSHALVQTERHVYRLRLGRLAPSEVKRLESVGSEITLALPRDAVDMAWRYRSEREGPVAAAIDVDRAVREEALARGDRLEIKGRVMASFQDDRVLIRVGERIYRVKTSAIGAGVGTSGVGQRISIDVPTKAIDFVWVVDPPAPGHQARSIASVRDGDTLVTSEGRVNLRGTVMPSFVERQVIVRSGNRYFLIERSALSRDAGGAPGERVSIDVPNEKIVMSWSVPE